MPFTKGHPLYGKPFEKGHAPYILSPEKRKLAGAKISATKRLRGVVISPEARQKMRLAKLGKKHAPHSTETKAKLRAQKLGANNPQWKGGIYSANHASRNTGEYRAWRAAVFARDNYRCVFCGLRGGWSKALKRRVVLNADHIKPFAFFLELRLAIDNGRTLCYECHKSVYRSWREYLPNH